MLEREALEAGQLPEREAPRPRRMAVDAAAARDGVSEGPVPRRRGLPEPRRGTGAVVWEVAGDATDRVVHRGVSDEVREAMEVSCGAVRGVRKIRERFAGAEGVPSSVIGWWKLYGWFRLTRTRKGTVFS